MFKVPCRTLEHGIFAQPLPKRGKNNIQRTWAAPALTVPPRSTSITSKNALFIKLFKITRICFEISLKSSEIKVE